MNNFQRIKDMVANSETPEELSCAMAVLYAHKLSAVPHKALP